MLYQLGAASVDAEKCLRIDACSIGKLDTLYRVVLHLPILNVFKHSSATMQKLSFWLYTHEVCSMYCILNDPHEYLRTSRVVIP